jgi:CHAT domain-containing protein/Tfp pilus assembly protein PilF
MARGYARCLQAGGAEAGAGADLDEAARLADGLRSAELACEVALRRGICAIYRGEAEPAEAYFRQAYAVARREKSALLEAKAGASLGFLRARTRHWDDATDWFLRALERASKLQADTLTVRLLVNLGWCYVELGDYEKALTFLSRADPLAQARGHTGDHLLTLQNMGNAHYKLRDLATAGEYYGRALAIARQLEDKKLTAELLSNLGIVALEQQRYDEAEVFVQEALRIKTDIGDQPSRQHSVLAEGQIWEGRGEYTKAEVFYREVIGSPHSIPALLGEARASMASLRMKTNQPADAESEFRKAFAVMEESLGELRQAEHKISFFSSLGQFYDNYVDFLVERGRAHQALMVADRSRARLLREKLGTETALPDVTAERVRSIARALDAVLLFYWTAPERSFLWAVTPQQVDHHTLPGENEIRKHVEAHQGLILRSRDLLTETPAEAEWLYRNLVAPAEASISEGSRVIVIPDGPLHLINLETLVVPSPKRHYWIDDVTVASAPSLSLLAGANVSRPQRATDGILIVGDVVSPNDEFPRLAHAATEVERIAEQFPPPERKVYSGADADPSVYRAADPGRFSFIHFAAHAKANPTIPLDSAVILSAKNEAYKLYARDILDIPLQADLVTLSACRSAGSRTFAGEGLVGLAWAFLSAGAGNVAAGLWNVEDASTSKLMAELYRGLKQGLRPGEALRAAKLYLLRSETAQRKPFYWAPFILYTQREPVPGKGAT